VYLIEGGNSRIEVYELDGTKAIVHVTRESKLLRMYLLRPSAFDVLGVHDAMPS
jgi:hypothetical protein